MYAVQRFEAGHPRHPQVQQHDIERTLRVHDLERRGPVTGFVQLVLILERQAEHAARRHLVVHDQDSHDSTSTASCATGSVKVKTAPDPGADCAEICP